MEKKVTIILGIVVYILGWVMALKLHAGFYTIAVMTLGLWILVFGLLIKEKMHLVNKIMLSLVISFVGAILLLGIIGLIVYSLAM